MVPADCEPTSASCRSAYWHFSVYCGPSFPRAGAVSSKLCGVAFICLITVALGGCDYLEDSNPRPWIGYAIIKIIIASSGSGTTGKPHAIARRRCSMLLRRDPALRSLSAAVIEETIIGASGSLTPFGAGTRLAASLE